MKKVGLLLVVIMAIVIAMGSLSPVYAQEDGDTGDGGGHSVQLVVTIAIIWLCIMGLVTTVVILTRRKAGEAERKSREG